MVATSLTLAFDWLPGEAGSVFTRLIGCVGLLFFGLCLGVVIWGLLVGRGAVITMTSEGLTDIRVAPCPIPWRAIEAIGVWEYSGQKAIVLRLDPAIEKGLDFRRATKWLRGPNRALGADGICIASMGLSIDHNRLLAEIRSRATRAQERCAD